MSSKNFTFYGALPIFLQNVICSYLGFREKRLRNSKYFYDVLEYLLQSEWESKSNILAFQDEQIKRKIKYAYEHVPYYRNMLQQVKLRPADINGIEDLKKLPILTKKELRGNWGSFLSNQYKKKALIFGHTSGSTGMSLSYYKAREDVAYQWAIWWRLRKRFGIEVGAPYVNFSGRPVVPALQNKPPYFRKNIFLNQRVFTMQHMVEEKITAIVSDINKMSYDYFNGFPSILDRFSRLADQNGLVLKKAPKAIFVGTENLYDFQRTAIEKFTQSKVHTQYGFGEGCGNASQCEFGHYHEDFEFGHLECVDPEYMPDGNIRGKIVATGFTGDCFPFIRYQVGDYGTWKPESYCCPCGRSSRVLAQIEGREEDYVVTPEGHKIMRFDYLFKETKNIIECQVIQEKLGEVILKIVRNKHYSIAEEQSLKEACAFWISPQLKLRFEYVTEIPRTSSGKFRAVISRIHSLPEQDAQKEKKPCVV